MQSIKIQIEEKKRKIHLLKMCKKYVKQGDYICYALNNSGKTFEQRLAVLELRDFIEGQLYPTSTLGGYIQRKYRLISVPENNDPKMIATRLAWLDWMIECLKEDVANLERKKKISFRWQLSPP